MFFHPVYLKLLGRRDLTGTSSVEAGCDDEIVYCIDVSALMKSFPYISATWNTSYDYVRSESRQSIMLKIST